MKNTIVILSIILLFSFKSEEKSCKLFHNHQQLCHLVGTSETDFVIQLFNDSTIKYIIYRTSYLDGYNEISKETHTGKYFQIKDTINTKYFSSSFVSKFRDNTSIDYYTDTILPQPSTTQFLISKKELTPLNGIKTPFDKISKKKHYINQMLKAW